MTSLLARLLRLFPESVPREDLFTEGVALGLLSRYGDLLTLFLRRRRGRTDDLASLKAAIIL